MWISRLTTLASITTTSYGLVTPWPIYPTYCLCMAGDIRAAPKILHPLASRHFITFEDGSTDCHSIALSLRVVIYYIDSRLGRSTLPDRPWQPRTVCDEKRRFLPKNDQRVGEERPCSHVLVDGFLNEQRGLVRIPR